MLKLIFALIALVLSSLRAVSRFDIGSPVDRLMLVNGYGNLIGLPFSSGTSNATTGVPTNGAAGFAKAALFLNVKGSAGTLVYVNTGTNTSATWTNIV